MPKRTNEFQEHVADICAALAGGAAQIIESHLVPDDCGIGKHEIDVYIRHSDGRKMMSVVIEAKNESRKMTIPQFNSYVGRHTGKCSVKADRVVLVTRKGFVKQVKDKAAILGFELYTLVETVNPRWPNPGVETWTRQNKPQAVAVTCDDAEHATSVMEYRVMCSCCGESRGSVMDAAKQMVEDLYAERPDLFAPLKAQGVDDPGQIVSGEMDLPLAGVFFAKGSERVELRGLRVLVAYRHDVIEGKVRDYDLRSKRGECIAFRNWSVQFPESEIGERNRLSIMADSSSFPRYVSGALRP